MKFSLRRDSLVTIVGLAVPVAIFVFAVYLPQSRLSRQMKREIAASRRTIRDFPLRMAEQESLRREIEKREAFLEQSDVLVPRSANVHDVLGQVARLADEALLTVTRLEPLPGTQHESYRAIPFRVSCTGRFRGIADFLRGMEQMDRMFTVEELMISQPGDSSGEPASADVHFSVYVKRTDITGPAEYDASLNDPPADTRIR